MEMLVYKSAYHQHKQNCWKIFSKVNLRTFSSTIHKQLAIFTKDDSNHTVDFTQYNTTHIRSCK